MRRIFNFRALLVKMDEASVVKMEIDTVCEIGSEICWSREGNEMNERSHLWLGKYHSLK